MAEQGRIPATAAEWARQMHERRGRVTQVGAASVTAEHARGPEERPRYDFTNALRHAVILVGQSEDGLNADQIAEGLVDLGVFASLEQAHEHSLGSAVSCDPRFKVKKTRKRPAKDVTERATYSLDPDVMERLGAIKLLMPGARRVLRDAGGRGQSATQIYQELMQRSPEDGRTVALFALALREDEGITRYVISGKGGVRVTRYRANPQYVETQDTTS